MYIHQNIQLRVSAAITDEDAAPWEKFSAEPLPPTAAGSLICSESSRASRTIPGDISYSFPFLSRYELLLLGAGSIFKSKQKGIPISM